MHEETKIQEEIKMQEETKIQEEIKMQEETKIQEEIKMQEEIKIQEENKMHEETKIQEEIKMQDEIKTQEKVKMQEINDDDITIIKEYDDGGFDIRCPNLDWYVLSKHDISCKYKIAEYKTKDCNCMTYEEYYTLAREIYHEIDDIIDSIDDFEELFRKYMYEYHKANRACEIFDYIGVYLGGCRDNIQWIADEGDKKGKKYDIVIVDGVFVEYAKKALVLSQNIFNIAYCISSIVASANKYSIDEIFEKMDEMISDISDDLYSVKISIDFDRLINDSNDINDVFHCFNVNKDLDFEEVC